jgi:hypothetical protein
MPENWDKSQYSDLNQNCRQERPMLTSKHRAQLTKEGVRCGGHQMCFNLGLKYTRV